MNNIYKEMMDNAKRESQKSECLRKKVGCCIWDQYNGNVFLGHNKPAIGVATCESEGECYIVNGGCARTLHAEVSAVESFMKDSQGSEDLSRSIAFITLQPCLSCLKFLIACGVKKVYFLEDYRIRDSVIYASDFGYPLEKWLGN